MSEFTGGFENLEVWKEARRFRISISEIIKEFPEKEKFRLIDQIIRSSRSITANIAEGYGRFHYSENIQSCRIARGSLMETVDHLICAFDEGYIDEVKLVNLKKQADHILKLMNGYVNYLKSRKDG
jgi:four helix bundle protein